MKEQPADEHACPDLLQVDTGTQSLRLLRRGEILRIYPVSTASAGLGFEPGSNKTPTGRFRIAEKIGHGEPPWMVFKSRVPTGEIARPGGDEDLILTRILWLEGLDPENSNTRERYIYFHGTNREDLIGTPASHGCIRLHNDDMLGLFAVVKEGTAVEIS